MRILCACMVVVLGLGFGNAVAEEKASNNFLDKRFTIYGGVFWYNADGEFSSTKEGQPKRKVDLDDLNLEENVATYTLGAEVALWKRFKLRLDYFGYHDDDKSRSEFDFDFDDLIIPVGAELNSSLDLDVYVVNLSFDIIHTERSRFGIGFGAHVADIDLDITAKATVNGNEYSLGSGSEDILAPLPNLYVAGAYGFTDRFIFRYGGGWLSLNYKDYDGSIWFANAFIEYWPFRHVGFGTGYRYVKVDFDYEPGKKKETYDITLNGPTAYIKVGF